MIGFSLLSKGKLKTLKKILTDTYGFNIPKEWVFLEKGKNKVWLTNKSTIKHLLEGLRVEGIGHYFGYLENNAVRLRVEAAQLVGSKATRNILELSEEQAMSYVKGYDLDIPNSLDKTYILLCYKNGFIGVGKNNGIKIFCQIPKERRIHKL